MPVITIYNNKGGVGKSTLTVGLAEFLAAKSKPAVLVIDLDAQASSSGSLLGRAVATHALRSQRTVTSLASEIIKLGKTPRDLSPWVCQRPASAVRGTALQNLSVLVPDKQGLLDLEEKMTPKDLPALRDRLKPSLGQYEYVLIDLPGNIDRRNRLAIASLMMSDFVLIPVEPSQIAMKALPDTLDLILYARNQGGMGCPTILGLVLNKTDKRTEQYRKRFLPILEASCQGNLPPVFDHIIPDTPKLATATDEAQDFHTRKDRFSTYYDHVRRVAAELEMRCKSDVYPQAAATPNYAHWLRTFFDRLWTRTRSKKEETVSMAAVN